MHGDTERPDYKRGPTRFHLLRGGLRQRLRFLSSSPPANRSAELAP